MKKITLLFSFIACALISQAQLLINENFELNAAPIIGQNGWVITGTSTTNAIAVTAPTSTPVLYSGYPSSGVGNEITLAATGQDVNKSFSSTVSTGFVYFSALVNFSAVQTGDYFLHIADSPTGSTFFGRVWAKADAGKVAIGITNTSQPSVGGVSPTPVPTYSATLCDLNTTYLIVVKVNVSTGESSIIVNPSMSTEPSAGLWSSNTWGTSALPTGGFKTINLRQGGSSSSPTLKIDGIRVATSWTDLFSTSGVNSPKANTFNVVVIGKKLVLSNVANGSTVEIYTALGSKVQSSELVDGSVVLNKLSKGLYIVRVGKQSQKFML